MKIINIITYDKTQFKLAKNISKKPKKELNSVEAKKKTNKQNKLSITKNKKIDNLIFVLF